MPGKLDGILKAIMLLNAGTEIVGEVIGLVRRKPDGTMDVIETLDSAENKFKNVQNLVSEWKAENME